MQNELPEWAMNTGLEIANGSETLGATIARALVAAERRGIERSAKECDRIAGNRADFNQDYRRCAGHCSFVIRQLGEEQ